MRTARISPMRVSYTFRTSSSTVHLRPSRALPSSAWKACGVTCGAAAAASAPGSRGVPPRLTTSCTRVWTDISKYYTSAAKASGGSLPRLLRNGVQGLEIELLLTPYHNKQLCSTQAIRFTTTLLLFAHTHATQTSSTQAVPQTTRHPEAAPCKNNQASLFQRCTLQSVTDSVLKPLSWAACGVLGPCEGASL